MPEFVLELFCEEIPARMQVKAAADLQRLAETALRNAGLEWTRSEAFSTPRRLTLYMEGLPPRQPDRREERKGPKVGAPQAAVDGFLGAAGVTLDQCEQRDTPKGPVWFAVLERPGQPTDRLLVDVIRGLLADMPWPKSMRWGESAFRWVRPMHHVLALFDAKPLIGDVEPDPHTRFVFTAFTIGHRFLAPDLLPVRDFASYAAGLRDAYVILDRDERRQRIIEGAQALTAAEGLTLRDDPGLLEEVVGLVEWPIVHMGRIDDAFMGVPEEVLITTMRTHQRYFSCLDTDGRLAPRFVVVANTATRDGGAEVVAGNERVLRARLSDAKFFWDQDRAIPLADRLPALNDIIFQSRLGSLADKVARLEVLAGDLAGRIPGADAGAARKAARLCKADLVTGMVYEFPELQGVMGAHYARAQGETEDVARAIGEHYAPQGPSDACPTAPLSVAVSLADKLDTLVGFFAIGETPTGSRDPFALRRAALGVIRVILENGLRVNLVPLFEVALVGVAASLKAHEPDKPHVGRPQEWPVGSGEQRDRVSLDLLAFFADRLKVALREDGVRHDLIDAVFALGGEDDLVRLRTRVDALAGFLASEDGTNLLTAFRRAENIVRIEAKKDGAEGFGAVAADSLTQDEEKALWAALSTAGSSADGAVEQEDFAAAMAALATLRAPVDAFFDRVTVNADDPALRRNRLAMLERIVATMDRVADFRRVEG